MTDRDRQQIYDAAALWMNSAIYKDAGGNYRWCRRAPLPRGATIGRVVPWNRVLKHFHVDLHEFARENGFADMQYRREYLRQRGLIR